MQTGGARLVTPEAVVLQFETASLGSRVPAALLDLVVQLGILMTVGIGLSPVGGTAGNVLLYLLITFVLLGYSVVFETLWRGRTPGKAALGLRVVRKDGAPVRFRHAVVRSFLGLVDFWLTTGAAAVIAVLLTRDNQRLGDLAAGTLVLRERSGAGRSAPVRFSVPYGWEGYAATLDTSGLSAAEYEAARSFLLRAASLPPEVRRGLALQVATSVAGRMRHRPPGGVDPELFLACVASAHQRRSAVLAGTLPGAPPAGSAPAAVWASAARPAGPPPGGTPVRAEPVAPRAGGFTPPS